MPFLRSAPERPRLLHLVDVENLTRTARPSRARVTACAAAYARLGLVGTGDHVVVACDRIGQLDVGLGWAGPRRLIVGRGRDGADRALLDVLRDERVTGRYGGIVVASGDHIFADPVRRLRAGGLAVTVVAHRDALSRRLRAAAGRRVVPFPDLGRTRTRPRGDGGGLDVRLAA